MLRLARPLASVPRRQILSRALLAQTRTFAERKDTILSSDPAFLPGTASKQAPAKPEIPLGPGGPGSPVPPPSSTGATIPPENVPKAPPPPPPTASTPTPPPPTTTPAPTAVTPPPPPPKPKRFRRLRAVLYILLFGALAYGGAIAYALRSDNFHDFFTEYVPFGETILLDIEERNFKKKFPNARLNTYRSPSATKQADEKVTIPSKSGLSWKVADEGKGSAGSDLTTKGKHMSAVDSKPPTKPEVQKAQEDPRGATPKEASAAVDRAKAKKEQKDSESEKAIPKVVSTEELKPKASPITKSEDVKPSPKPSTSTSDTRPPVIAPVTQISPLTVANADESVVQELVKVVNDLITVINSDSPDAANKYFGPMEKAKESLAQVAGKIGLLRDAERKAAEERIAQAHKEFDQGARQLLERIETAQKEDDIRYREEFESERAKISQQYEQRLKTEIERTHQVAEQRFQNMIAEQAIEMKRKFISDIQSLVEAERNGRLSKLTDLSTNVDNLTELTSNWNGIIDSNLATQKLQVAVDSVRSALQSSNLESKPKPFVREMAALKLTAEGDPVVEAAVASINPQAYQRGIPSAAQLIDRFRRVASEVRKASLLPEDAGVASHAASVVLSKVMFKKAGQPEGNDVESILTRTETLLEEGDLDSAAREMNGLQGWASVLSKDWLNDARKVLEVQQALEVIETEARLQCLRVS